MRAYVVKGTTLDHDGVEHPAGNIVELSDAHAAPLLRIGVVEESDGEPTKPAKKPKAPK